MKDWIEYFRTATTGMRVSHVWLGHGAPLFVECGKLTPSTIRRPDGTPGAPMGEIGLMIESSWRIEQGHVILCGIDSSAELRDRTLAKLVGAEVVGLSMLGRLPELLVSLSEDVHIVSFMTVESDGPGWSLFDRRSGHEGVAVGWRAGRIEAEPAGPGRALVDQPDHGNVILVR